MRHDDDSTEAAEAGISEAASAVARLGAWGTLIITEACVAVAGWALVACGLEELGGAGSRPESGVAARSFSVTARLTPTTCVMPCAPRNAAMATSARITAQK